MHPYEPSVGNIRQRQIGQTSNPDFNGSRTKVDARLLENGTVLLLPDERFAPRDKLRVRR